MSGLTAWERWELASFDERPAASNEIAVPPAPTLEAASPVGGADAAGPSAAEQELAALREAAYRDAYEQGRQEGLDAGHKEGYAAGQSDGEIAGRTLAETLVREQAEALAAQVARLDGEIGLLDQRLADELLALAVEIARKLVGHTLAAQPQSVLNILHQALAQLPVQHITVRLHPDDAALLRQHAAETLAHGSHRLVDDARLARGDVVLDAGGSHLDATLATRWHRPLDDLGPVADWGAPTPLPAAAATPRAPAPPAGASADPAPDSAAAVVPATPDADAGDAAAAEDT